MGPTIETARLALRPVAVEDRPDLIALERDPEVMRFLNGGQPTPVVLVHVDTRFVSYADPLPGAEEGDVVYELTRAAWLSRGSR